ncbi:hypothetical protein AWB79_04010 [Caballeronia hypogeia]|uniref:Uncharacterized protein n=1 Tax=Caballeronia hypogeia TaxID=1777140 RepID=A0A158BPJ3_9BURK|nr:hypothetical protein [Caballeronia hypogeia]SAK71931.1 hypothetical protein AWB79_04010 [Caballeronia hypogeia]
MRRKSQGVAVAAVLIGVAVAAVVYIASIGHSRHADAPVPHSSALAATQNAEASQAAAFDAGPKAPESASGEQTAAR